MFTVTVGKNKMGRTSQKRMWSCLLLLLLVGIVIAFILQGFGQSLTSELHRVVLSLSSDLDPRDQEEEAAGDHCPTPKNCSQDQISFYIQSGAASVVPPKICLQDKVVLGKVTNNVGLGINVVVMDGKTGNLLKTGNFDMYSGEIKPLVDFLRSIQPGEMVLMATYDDPWTKLDEEARRLISDLGSQQIHNLSFRDNWLFVGGQGAGLKTFEKLNKNDIYVNLYDYWPELITMEGCVSVKQL